MYQPLADKIRPLELDDMVGQQHIIGEGGLLRRILESGHIPNMIFTAPPAWARPPWPRSSPTRPTAVW